MDPMRNCMEGIRPSSHPNWRRDSQHIHRSCSTATPPNGNLAFSPVELSQIAASDHNRALLVEWPFTHPRYLKWSTNLCRPDDLVITAHLEALALIDKEGLQGLQNELTMCLFCSMTWPGWLNRHAWLDSASLASKIMAAPARNPCSRFLCQKSSGISGESPKSSNGKYQTLNVKHCNKILWL